MLVLMRKPIEGENRLIVDEEGLEIRVAQIFNPRGRCLVRIGTRFAGGKEKIHTERGTKTYLHIGATTVAVLKMDYGTVELGIETASHVRRAEIEPLPPETPFVLGRIWRAGELVGRKAA